MKPQYNVYNITTTLNEIVITIENPKGNKFAIGFLLFWAVIIAIFPFLFFIIVAILREGLPFSFMIVCFISFCVAYYLFKIIFWNIYGKEIITISKNETLSIQCDYRFLRDKVKLYSFVDIKIMYQDNISNSEQFDVESNIYFKLDEKEPILTSSKLPIFTIEKISEQVFSFLNDENKKIDNTMKLSPVSQDL